MSGYRQLLLVCTALGLLASCKDKEETKMHEGPSYISIKQMGYDAVMSQLGEPFTLNKIINLNGKVDSILYNSYNADWAEVLKVFFATDISDEKYAGRYDVSLFDDPGTYSKVLYYTAKDEKLFTRVVQIRLDPDNGKVKAVYIETAKKNFWDNCTQKLYYAPKKLILIQESDEPLIGESKELKVEYHLPLFYE